MEADDEAGLGLVGTGEGGGGTGEGTIGLGSLGEAAGARRRDGHGIRLRDGSGALGGGAGGGSKGRVAAATAMTTGTGLATEVIQRVVRRNINQIQYCYEKAMTKAPTIAGKVAVSFTIDAQGAVTAATAADTNITDADMISCVCGAVKKMAFPAPDGGGVMIVTYPFNFSPANP